ncbi:hypothetical protein GCM10018952_06520 [Streptosporangium vulgare]
MLLVRYIRALAPVTERKWWVCPGGAPVVKAPSGAGRRAVRHVRGGGAAGVRVMCDTSGTFGGTGARVVTGGDALAFKG